MSICADIPVNYEKHNETDRFECEQIFKLGIVYRKSYQISVKSNRFWIYSISRFSTNIFPKIRRTWRWKETKKHRLFHRSRHFHSTFDQKMSNRKSFHFFFHNKRKNTWNMQYDVANVANGNGKRMRERKLVLWLLLGNISYIFVLMLSFFCTVFIACTCGVLGSIFISWHVN